MGELIVWHWQALKRLSSISLEARVIIVSVILHAFLLIAIFVVYQGGAQYHITISSTMINPDAEIVFMPLHRSLQQGVMKGSVPSEGKTAAKKSSLAAAEQTPKDGTTLVKIVQSKPKAKVKKEIKKADTKKVVDKKNTSAQKTEPAKQETSAQKNEEVKPEPAKATLQESLNEQSSNTSVANATDTNVVYVGQAEMDALQAQEYIQQELAQHWSPPAGMRADLFVIVILSIDFEGAIKKVDIATSSGNLLFDTAAKKAAAQITPARWAYGKELSITFKP